MDKKQDQANLLNKQTKVVGGIPLDYSIELASERTQFVTRLLSNTNQFLTDKDHDLLTNYIMCGRDSLESKSPIQQKLVYLEGKGPRANEQPLQEDLDETTKKSDTLVDLNGKPIQQTHYTVPRPNFSRKRIALKGLTKEFEDLWARIDNIDRIIRIRRNLPVEPIATPEERARINKIPQYKMRHYQQLLVDLRREQYTLRDQFEPELQRHDFLQDVWRGGEIDEDVQWGAELVIAPLGLRNGAKHDPLFDSPWCANSYLPDYQLGEKASFDFRNPQHIYYLVMFEEEMVEESVGNCESPVPQLFATLHYYEEKAFLSDEQRDVLRMRAHHYTNDFIARQINEKFGKKHSSTYMSTMFTKQVCGEIAAAASLHEDTYLARGIPSKFQQCRECGEFLLLDERNFMKAARSRNGFSYKCKRCEKKARQNKKEQEHQLALQFLAPLSTRERINGKGGEKEKNE